jgi:hypothetical protein
MFARERETSRAKLAFFLAITCVCWSAADMLGIIHHFVLVDFKYLPERDRWRNSKCLGGDAELNDRLAKKV